MDSSNPYRTPSAELGDVSATGELELAGRGHRFGAAMIDGIIASAIVLPAAAAMGLVDFSRHSRQHLGASIVLAFVGFVAFALVHSYFLRKNGQTIGKKIVGIRIVDIEGNAPSLGRVLGARYGLVYLFNSLPVLGGLAALIDVLFIFRRDRRCIHDLVAGTRVVMHDARYSSLTWFVLPFITMLVLLIGGGIVLSMVQYEKAKSQYEHPAPASGAAPARQAPAAHPSPPETNGRDALLPAEPSPAPAPNAPAQATADVPAAAPTPDPARPSDAELRKCLGLKDPAAIIRCSQGGK